LEGIGGARQTGGGFGGCVVAAAPRAKVPAVLAAIEADYRTPNNKQADVFVCQAVMGAQRL
jgi:galactokinase